MTPPQPAQLVSVPQYAQMRRVAYRTLHRDLLALWTRDVAEGGGDWLVRLGRRRKLWVNLSRLEAAHPVLFQSRTAAKDDLDAAIGRIERLERNERDLKQRVNAMGARLRCAIERCQPMPVSAIGSTDL